MLQGILFTNGQYEADGESSPAQQSYATEDAEEGEGETSGLSLSQLEMSSIAVIEDSGNTDDHEKQSRQSVKSMAQRMR